MSAVKETRESNTLAEAKRLHDLGWAVHWLRPRNKAPLRAGWTTGPRAPWEELRREYRADLNLGVRLGEASRLATGYLACLDCDVKSEDPAHRAEMEVRLEELYPGLTTHAPTVSSGRGLGSRHFYGVTTEPQPYLTLAQSGDEARVRMPSVKPSRRELAVLSEADIKAGIRLRPAWEITLMGRGRQTALPPSIHPDSGKRYVWDRPFAGADSLPALDPPASAGGGVRAGRGKSPAASPESFRFQVTPVDLYMDARASTGLLALVVDADGVEDQSAALFRACRWMVNAGFSRDEILTVLTDPENALGECAYRHVQKPVDVRYRERAAFWLDKYTLATTMEKQSAQAEFERVSETEPLAETPPLSEEEASAQAASVLPGGDLADWQGGLERGGPNGEGRPKPTLANCLLVLQNAVARNVFRRNQFTGLELYGVDTPWGGRAGVELKDADLIAIKVWLADHFRFEPPVKLINEAVTHIAGENGFHPVREYLDQLEWDGVPRINTWLSRYLEAKAPEPYLSAISRKVLVAMVARVMRPGVKFDTVLILEGSQGVGKSTVIRKLVGDEWFSDAHIEIKDKDAVLAMRGVWAVELGELSSLRKADVDQLKEFMSRTTDRIRVPYGHRTEAFPRQCVFIGTTNSSEYFRDPTGNRRFWPVTVGNCDFEGVARVRDQLFAEAKWYYDLGEALYLDDKEAVAGAVAEQMSRTFVDALSETVAEFLENLRDQAPGERRFNPDSFTMSELFGDHGPLAGTKMDQQAQNRAGTILRGLGFTRVVRKMDQRSVRLWRKTTP